MVTGTVQCDFGSFFETVDVEAGRLYSAIDKSLLFLSEQFQVPVPSYRFNIDTRFSIVYNATYDGRGNITFARANPEIIAHEFGHHWLEHQGDFPNDAHEQFAREFAQANKHLLERFFVEEGL